MIAICAGTRLFSWTFFHFDLLHLLMNMLAFVPLGSLLERRIGTWQSVHLFFVGFPVVSGLLYFGLSWIGGTLFSLQWLQGPLYSCVAGLSGPIFSLIVVDSLSSYYDHQRDGSGSGGGPQRMILFFTVPALYYPWALLLFIQFLIPQASLLGHLMGMITGYLYCWGWLRMVILPESLITKLQDHPQLQGLTHRPGFYQYHQGGGELLPFSNIPSPSASQIPSPSRYHFNSHFVSFSFPQYHLIFSPLFLPIFAV